MLEHFFAPKTVAVVGASREEGKVGHDLLKNLLQYRFAGKIFPINPHPGDILGIKSYTSVKEVSEKLDLVVIIVPAQYVGKIVDDCVEKGVDSIIVISAGFKESGIDGAARERELLQKLKAHSIRMVGPNCLGLINTQANLNASFAAGMPAQGDVAFFSQSGALCTSILDWAMGASMGFSKFISMGNKSDVDEVDMIKALDADPATRVILGYLEGVKNGAEFMAASRQTTRKKPMIIVKSGGTAAGAKAASSHTGALAGSENAFDAACKQSGILRVKTLEELFDCARVFSAPQLPKGQRIALITNAGGPGIIAADAVERSRLKMAGLSKNTIDFLRASLPPTASVYNPIDVLGDAKADRYKIVLEKTLEDPNVDVVLIILTPQAMTEIDKTAELITAVSRRTDKLIVTSFMGGVRVESGIKILCQAKVPNYAFPERAISAIETAYRYTEWQKRPGREVKTFQAQKETARTLINEARQKNRRYLSEEEAKQVISNYGFVIPRSILAASEEETASAAEEIGYPVVIKISSPDILHKSDFGGVAVGVKTAADARRFFCEITQKARRLMPDADVKGVLVQQMVTGGKEVILGMSRDPQFGPLLTFGLGGIYVEALKDVSFRVAPIDARDAEEMIREIRAFTLLKGVRGEPPSDLGAIIDSLLKLSQMVTDFPEIMEVDINPLVVFPEGKGAIAIDARLALE
ncbi:MAG: acetyl coenzyme synthetase forming, alpha domain protein [Candidatus Brocadiaceae bacterium]|nr:acetyl coenzyme synthetase forming, alpha domain protein [Candidatus Brocadiaceae bacterium]